MSRMNQTLDKLAQGHRKALVPYITAGDPQLKLTVPIMHALVKAGADMIELGMPFTDPMAEGPVIQHAHERALANGTKMHDIFAAVREFRERDPNTPVILMGYLNPIEIMGYENFANAAAQAGVDGVLIVDLPPEEGEQLSNCLQQQAIASIYLISPTTTIERLALVKKYGRGYHYYVSLKGITGSAKLDAEDVASHLQAIREHLSLPIYVGFGIRDAESAASIAKIADGVVIGSALIARMGQFNQDDAAILAEVEQFMSEIRSAL